MRQWEKEVTERRKWSRRFVFLFPPSKINLWVNERKSKKVVFWFVFCFLGFFWVFFAPYLRLWRRLLCSALSTNLLYIKLVKKWNSTVRDKRALVSTPVLPLILAIPKEREITLREVNSRSLS